jgi:hypothetical protein
MNSSSSVPTLKPPRAVQSTPRRPLSASGSDDGGRLPRATTPSLLTASKKYRAPLSLESRPRSPTKPRPTSSMPTSPVKKSHDVPRPKTPSTPRGRDTDSPLLRPVSAMDVRNVDPEEALVDFQTVDAGDMSADIDEAFLRDLGHGSQDKVLVSIRCASIRNGFAQVDKITVFAQRMRLWLGRRPLSQQRASSSTLSSPSHLPCLLKSSTLTKFSLDLTTNRYTMPLPEAMWRRRWTVTMPLCSHTVSVFILASG